MDQFGNTGNDKLQLIHEETLYKQIIIFKMKLLSLKVEQS